MTTSNRGDIFHDRRRNRRDQDGTTYPFREEDEPADWEKEPYLDETGRYSG